MAAVATGDALFVVEIAVGCAAGDAMLAAFRTAAEFPEAGIVAAASATSPAEAGLNSACLNSTDFNCPLVAIIQSVSPNARCEIPALEN